MLCVVQVETSATRQSLVQRSLTVCVYVCVTLYTYSGQVEIRLKQYSIPVC